MTLGAPLSLLAATVAPRSPGCAFLLDAWAYELGAGGDEGEVAEEARAAVVGAQRLAALVPEDLVHRDNVDVLQRAALLFQERSFMRADQLARVEERLKTDYPHSKGATKLRAAVVAMVAFAKARVDVDRELRDATHDAGGPELGQALQEVARAHTRAVSAFLYATHTDQTEKRAETAFVEHSLVWLDGDCILFEAGCLLDHCAELEKMAGDITTETPVVSERIAAEMSAEG